jgi:hypothetical protein
MEDVLAVYTRPHDPECPLVCLDETSKQSSVKNSQVIDLESGNGTLGQSNLPESGYVEGDSLQT